jgi:hypothetical protein
LKSQLPKAAIVTGFYLLVAASTLSGSGCLLVAAGAAGGAAAGYAYAKGKVCEVYNSGFNDTWAATHTALTELAMPILREELQGEEGSITSQTADGDRVRIQINALESRIPAEGRVTRVCVRVATFGDHPVSSAVLNQVGRHLVPATAIAGTPAPAPAARLGVIQAGATNEPPLAAPAPSATQTAPPPLLPAEPVPVGKTPPK